MDGGKAVLDVEAQHHLLARVRSRVGDDGASLHETVGEAADRELSDKHPVEHSQGGFQPLFRSADQPLLAVALRDRERHVMRGAVAATVDAERLQLFQRQAERRRDVGFGVPDRQTVARKLRFVGSQIHDIAISRAEGWTEKPPRVHLREIFRLGRAGMAAVDAIRRRLRQQPFVSHREPVAPLLPGAARDDGFLPMIGVFRRRRRDARNIAHGLERLLPSKEAAKKAGDEAQRIEHATAYGESSDMPGLERFSDHYEGSGPMASRVAYVGTVAML